METAILSCRCIDSQPPSSVEALQFSPDGRWLAVGRSSGIVEVFSSVSRHVKLRLSTASCSSVRNIIWLPLTLGAAASSAVSEAGGATTDHTDLNEVTSTSLFEWRLITTGLHGVITSWNLRTCRVQAECPSNGGAVFCLCRCPPEMGSPAFAAACDDGRVRLLHVSGAADRACRERSEDPYVGMLSSDNETAEEIHVTHTLPKTKSRLLSVCWYSQDLIFAGNASSCILRFSRGGAQSAFVADGQMALENKSLTGDRTESNTTLVWNLRALRRRSLLLSGDSRGRITLWSLPTCVALQTLHVHVADILDIQLMVCIDSLIADTNQSDAQTVRRKEEVVLSVGVDGKLSAISRTEGDRWVVRACRYPHLCDSQAVACLPRVPGGPDGSLIVTGAADGSIKWMRNLTELAGLKAPCLPFCLSPSLRGLQRPKVIWKKRLLVCPAATEIGIWHIEDGALNGSISGAEKNGSADSPQSPLIKLARITLQKQSKINCCDAARDGQLLAVGSNDGLHLFAFHVKELEIQDLQCLGACRIKEMVTALQFVSRSVLACCFFSNKRRKATNYRRLRGAGPAAGSASAGEGMGGGVDEKTQKGRGKTEDESCCSATSKKWICKEVPCLREAETLPDRLGETDGSFYISFVKVSTGVELASVRDLPFPVIHMDLSPDGKKLGCLNSNSSIFVFDVDSFELIYFLPNIFRRGENVANFCFSPDSARLFVLGTRNGYFLTEANELDSSLTQNSDNNKGDGKADWKNNRKPQRQRRNVRSIPARQLSREDGSIVHCKWVEDEGTAYVLCMTPSSLYKLSLGDVSVSMDVENRQKKKQGGEIRLLNLSSDSEEDRDCQDNGCSPGTRSFPRQLKRLRGPRPIVISAAPVYAAPFCVPRVLPASLSRLENQEDSSSPWGSQASLPCGASPGGTDSTRSTATTPGDSPVSYQRGGDRDAPAEGSSRKRIFNSIAHTARLLLQSDNKGFVGFALEKCDAPTATQMLPCSSEPCNRALILLEVLNTGTQNNSSSLPPFNRKRYGT